MASKRPSLARRAAGRVRRERARRRATQRRGPTLSVVVPFYNVEQYLDECLTSLRQQHYGPVEIVLVDDGSPDGSLAIAERHASQDKRIRIVRRENGGLSAARNTGIEAATGEYLTFVDSDDVVLPDGYRRAIGGLSESGSDFAILPYERLRGRERTTPTWIADLYADSRSGRTIATDPDLMVHATAWSKVYRRSFWNEAGLSFREGVLYEDQEVTAAAHVAATAVDVVAEPTYLWRHRAQSITREFSARTVHAFFDAVDASLAIYDAVPGARRERARQVLSNDTPHYVRNLPRIADPEVEQALAERIPPLMAAIEPGDLNAECPAEMRVALTLIGQGRLDELHSFLNHEGLDLSAHESVPESAGPSMHLPLWGDPSLDPSLFVLSERQTVLDARVLRARLTDEGADLTVWAYLRHLDAAVPPSATFRWVDRLGAPVAELDAVPADETVGHHLRTVRESNEHAIFRVRGPWPDHAGPLRLEATVTHLGRTRHGIVADRDDLGSAAVAQSAGGWTLSPTGPFSVARTPMVELRAERASKPPEIATITVNEDGVHLEVDGPVGSVALVSSRVRLVGRRTDHGWTVPLEAPLFDRGTFPAPIGDYAIEVDGRQVAAGHDLLLTLPTTFRLDRTRGRVVLVDGRAVVRIDKPRTDLEQSVWGQRRLRAAYRAAEVEVQPRSALLQCYGAEVATDSPLAMHEEIRRRDPSWTLWWGVVDHAVALPDGAIPLVAGTEAWYDAMARAQLLIKNIELPAYLRKRPGQVHVQTFHGQPFKSMGRALWSGRRDWPEWRVRYEVAERRSSRWDLIVSPHAEGTRHYREQFDYDGPAFELGMPRVDALAAPDRGDVRARVRDALGIGDRIAVLNAATWRDDRGSGPMGARDVEHLDLERLARDLGDRYVVLQRSHGSVARTDRRHGHRIGVIDVTDHPEINELVLAADVAVLDYSSLRFDAAVADLPMVFLVPDLAEYEGSTRGFLFPYEGTAPGPWVRTRAELTERLRTVDAWRPEHAEAYAAFDARFNPHHDGRATERLVDRVLDELS